jgi:tetratricopeptide (TPR) repeat protein
MGFILSRIHLPRTLLVGLGSGLFLFVLLFTYFFYGSGPRVKSSTTVPVAAIEKKSAGLILMPPPSVPPLEPPLLGKEGPPTKGLKAHAPTGKEKSPSPDKSVEDRGNEKPQLTRADSKIGGQAKAREPQKKSAGSKLAITPDLSEEVRYHFNLALFYQEEKNFPLARRAYEKVVQMWPLYAEAHNNLGVVYKELGMYDQAIAELQKALTLNPRYPRAHHNMGVIHQMRGDWKQATRHYEMALALDRNHISSYNNLGLVHRSQERLHEAREILEKALSINPSYSQTHYNLALVLEDTGELERARFHYQKFVDLSGDESGRLVERVRAHLQGLVVKK